MIYFMSQSKGIDILPRNETKLHSTIKDNKVHLPGNDVVRKDVKIIAEMVVVSVFTCDLISIFTFVLTSVRVILNALLLKLRLRPQSKPLLVSTCYKPPQSSPSGPISTH